MAHEELQQARQLINKGRYDEAREILESLNHPTAIQWLEKLNRMTTSTLSENSNRHAAENEAKVERVVKESGVKEGIRFLL
jgi:Fic family protein